MVRNTPRTAAPVTKMMALIGLSWRRCMKNSATNEALMVAMPSAMTTFQDPKLSPAASTVITVNARRVPRTFA